MVVQTDELLRKIWEELPVEVYRRRPTVHSLMQTAKQFLYEKLSLDSVHQVSVRDILAF